MISRLIRVTIIVRDQDDALQFYTEKLGLEKRADIPLGQHFRWLTVAPKGQEEVEIVLEKPVPTMHGEQHAAEMLSRVGQGTTWVFSTDDCRAEYETLLARGVTFTSQPTEKPYGIEAVFVDLYGNLFSLLQPAQG